MTSKETALLVYYQWVIDTIYNLYSTYKTCGLKVKFKGRDRAGSKSCPSTDKEQQHAERGFAFLKDLLFLRTRVLRFPQNREMSVADSVFLKSPRRIETMAMLMGLCLMVYSLPSVGWGRKGMLP